MDRTIGAPCSEGTAPFQTLAAAWRRRNLCVTCGHVVRTRFTVVFFLLSVRLSFSFLYLVFHLSSFFPFFSAFSFWPFLSFICLPFFPTFLSLLFCFYLFLAFFPLYFLNFLIAILNYLLSDKLFTNPLKSENRQAMKRALKHSVFSFILCKMILLRVISVSSFPDRDSQLLIGSHFNNLTVVNLSFMLRPCVDERWADGEKVNSIQEEDSSNEQRNYFPL